MDKRMFPIQSQRGAKPHPTAIPWSVADLAYSVYSARYGRGQSLEHLAYRGGFGPNEMDDFLPDWRERCDEIIELRAQVQALIGFDREGVDKLLERWDQTAPHIQRGIVAKFMAMFQQNAVDAKQTAACLRDMQDAAIHACQSAATMQEIARDLASNVALFDSYSTTPAEAYANAAREAARRFAPLLGEQKDTPASGTPATK